MRKLTILFLLLWSVAAFAAGPTISGIAVSSVTPSTVVIQWTTGAGATSQIFYGVGNTSTATPLSSSLVTSHSITLTGLSQQTVYSYQVKSTNSGGSTTSSTNTFALCNPGNPNSGYTSVSASENAAYATGTVTATWTDNSGVSTSTPTVCGTTFATTPTGNIGLPGNLVMQLPDNNYIIPSPSSWVFTQSNASGLSANEVISGRSIDLTTAFGLQAAPSTGGSGGVNITTAETGNVPSPLYSPSETPASSNPYIFSQDVNGNWHTQAVIDTTTANGGTGNGPADPAGTLTWTRRNYWRDGLTSTQQGKNAFLSYNHTAQAGTLSTNQDRGLWGSMGNPTGLIGSFSITNNVVTFEVSNPTGPFFAWLPGQNIFATGLSTGTYLNNVALTVISVGPNGGNYNVTASSSSFTHANVSLTADAGRLDLNMYSMEVAQMELDLAGAPAASGMPDAEYRTLSLQCNDDGTGQNNATPALGFGCIRAEYDRYQTSTGSNLLAPWNVFLQMLNDSPTGTGGETWVNLMIRYGDESSGGPAPQTSYEAIEIDKPITSVFSRNNYGLVVQNWPTQARGTFNDWAAFFGTGEIYYDGTHTVNTADMAGTATVLASTTSIAVTYSIQYIGASAPVVTLTPLSSPGVFYWVTNSGSTGAWTGFTITMASAPGGNVSFNYHVDGQL